jgi:hypothetical protein
MKARFKIMWNFDYMYWNPPLIGHFLIPLNEAAERMVEYYSHFKSHEFYLGKKV